MKAKSKFSFYNLTVPQLFLILGGIILIAPLVFTMGAFWGHWDFSETGQIGDTLGGVTAPFISAFAAVLVFVAFKEQIRANNLLKETQLIQNLQLEINRLEDDFLDLKSLLEYLSTVQSQAFNWKTEVVEDLEVGLSEYDLYKLSYFFFVFEGIYGQLSMLSENDSTYYKKRLRELYFLRYKSLIDGSLELIRRIKRPEPKTEELIKTIVKQNQLFQARRDFS